MQKPKQYTKATRKLFKAADEVDCRIGAPNYEHACLLDDFNNAYWEISSSPETAGSLLVTPVLPSECSTSFRQGSFRNTWSSKMLCSGCEKTEKEPGRSIPNTLWLTLKLQLSLLYTISSCTFRRCFTCHRDMSFLWTLFYWCIHILLVMWFVFAMFLIKPLKLVFLF